MSKQPSLFDALGPSPELKRRLQQLAAEMLDRAQSHGCGFDEVRMAAETRGWLTGEEVGRFLSFGDGCMRAAGGIATRYRPSRHPRSHRRRIAVFVHRKFLPMEVAS